MITVVENSDYSFRLDERSNGMWLICYLRGKKLIETRLEIDKIRALRDYLCCLEIK